MIGLVKREPRLSIFGVGTRGLGDPDDKRLANSPGGGGVLGMVKRTKKGKQVPLGFNLG